MPLKRQLIQATEHNIAQFQMQIKHEVDSAKRAALEALLVDEQAKRKNMLRSG
jgi:hypothetical protein